MPVLGLHHVTAICGPAQANLDAYGGLLGLRLVKQTVNFDDPGTYHLYYADGAAEPGSFLTFFPWGDGAMPGRVGPPQATATAYAAPVGAVDLWMDRLAEHGPRHDVTFGTPVERFGERVLRVVDGDGLRIEIVEAESADGGWAGGPVPEAMALGAFHGVTLDTVRPGATARVLEALGYEPDAEADGRIRFAHPDAPRARFVDLVAQPDGPAGRMGVGTVHHVAFRVADDDAEMEVRETLLGLGLQPTPQIDRQYFHSVYCREPGGVLFEIATDNPGFAVDEAPDALGRELRLPPQYEPQRAAIEARLTPLRLPYDAPSF